MVATTSPACRALAPHSPTTPYPPSPPTNPDAPPSPTWPPAYDLPGPRRAKPSGQDHVPVPNGQVRRVAGGGLGRDQHLSWPRDRVRDLLNFEVLDTEALNLDYAMELLTRPVS